MKVMLAGVASLVALVFLMGTNQAGEKKEPKHSIKEVMKLAHQGGLLKKVVSGKASQEEKEELTELYVSLAQGTPPQGEAEDWKELTQTIVKQARAAAKGDKNAPRLLQKAVNCAGCHKKFKG